MAMRGPSGANPRAMNGYCIIMNLAAGRKKGRRKKRPVGRALTHQWTFDHSTHGEPPNATGTQRACFCVHLTIRACCCC